MQQLSAGVFLVLLAAAPAGAQAVSTSQITGIVRDESGAALPGVTITATQTETGLTRVVVSDDVGGYVITSLPVGPYRLEFALQGFRTSVQTGIVLQVNTNPTINATLALGELTETIQVEAQTPLIETRSSGIGIVVDNERVLELPLDGRQTLDLVYMTGMAAPSGTLSGARGGQAGPGSPGTIAVAGGLPNGTTYVLDGGTHNDPYNNAAMPFPFPEALQEFKVETSALPAQYGYHSAAVVNAVTRSGTNTFSGTLFEFLRDDALNARDPFAPTGPDGKRRRDGLNRNQFGGALGGPVLRDRLFFFGAYQRTRSRRTPTSSFQFVPTPAMLAGDFTAIASPACNAGRQMTLRAPFANNRVNPALFSPASLRLVSMLPVPDNPCGQVFFDRVDNSDEHVFTARIDYMLSNSQSMFGRIQATRFDSPTNYDGKTPMSFSTSAFKNRVYSLVVGDTTLFGSNSVNSLRGTVNRGDYDKTYQPLFDYNDLGIRATNIMPDYLRMNVSGGFSLMGPGALPTKTPTWTFQVADDLSLVRGRHQFGFGGEYIHNRYDSVSYLAASGNTTFTGQVTGLGLADFMLGRAASFTAGTLTGTVVRYHYIGLYAQDGWRISPNMTLNLGLRWDPYLPVYNEEGRITRFDRERFDRGIRSTVFPNAPAGLTFPGDEGMPGNSLARNDLWNFAPRVGLVWDPEGEGRQTLRTAYGRLYDLPHMQTFSTLAQMAPWGNTILVNNLPAGWDDPWATVPGGDPIPSFIGGPNRNTQFPLGANYTTFPPDLPATSTDQWNVSYQRQIAADWMVSANYLGNMVKHVWTANQINPAVYIPGASTVANTNQRRVLTLQNAAEGRFYASIQELDPNGTSNYHGLLLSVQRRRAAGFSLQGNYTISRCETDRWNQEPGVSGQPYMIPGNRAADRGRCLNSPEHTLNASVVYQIPAAGGSAVTRALTGGWQVSAIVSARSGSYFTVTTGVDNALTGQPNQRAHQVLRDPFTPNPTFAQWLNPDAFEAPAPGTYGTMPIDAIQGPGRFNVDMGLARAFGSGRRQIQLRLEAFNLLNTVNPANPVAAMNSPDFGQINSLATGTAPRIMQLAVKYLF